MTKEDIKQQILQEAIKIIPFDGWTERMLEDSCKAAGKGPKYGHIAFKGGLEELYDYFMRNIDAQMLKKLKSTELAKLKIREKIYTAVRTRIELYHDIKPTIRKTMSFLAMPQNQILATKSLWKTADEIWHICGDTSADFNHYTKRMILSAVYTSTILYWLNDESKDSKETWSFLERRINDVMKIEQAKGKIKKMFNC